MKHFAYYFGIAAALVASCSIQEEDIKTPQQDDVIFYASFEQPAEEGTRVYANEDLLLRWTADDRVSIFNKITYNQEYKFLGETGDNAGGFNRVDNAEFVTGNPISHVVSVYPYQAATRITEEEVVTLTLPAEQHYAENTFGLGANTMVSVSEDNVLQYKNVGGYLVLKLYGEGVSVSSITLKGNNGEKLAGQASVTMPLDGVPSAVFANDASDEITLVCDSPVILGATAEESVAFWIVVPPVTFSKGITIRVSSADGIFRKTTDKTLVIERSKLSKMASLDVQGAVSVPEVIDLGLPSGLKWASFNLGASRPEEYGDYYAWGETETYYSSLDPLTWKSGKSYWVDSYKWCNGSSTTLTKYNSDPTRGIVDNKTALDPEDDVAHVVLGNSWRMPTEADWDELRENCIWTWTAIDGVHGYMIMSNREGFRDKGIFLPAAGHWAISSRINPDSNGNYWSSSLDINNTAFAVYLDFYSESISKVCFNRWYGRSIRPVCD